MLPFCRYVLFFLENLAGSFETINEKGKKWCEKLLNSFLENWDSFLNFMYHLGEKNLIPFQEIGVHFQQKKP
jgi:hypothetical protein